MYTFGCVLVPVLVCFHVSGFRLCLCVHLFSLPCSSCQFPAHHSSVGVLLYFPVCLLISLCTFPTRFPYTFPTCFPLAPALYLSYLLSTRSIPFLPISAHSLSAFPSCFPPTLPAFFTCLPLALPFLPASPSLCHFQLPPARSISLASVPHSLFS